MSVTVEIDGVGEVEFDDDFKDLTREQQQRLINRIARGEKGLRAKTRRTPMTATTSPGCCAPR